MIAALLSSAFFYGQNMPVKATSYLGITTAQSGNLSTTDRYPVFYDTTIGAFMKWNGTAYEKWEINDLTDGVVWDDVPDANITESSVTQHESALSITSSNITDATIDESDLDASVNASLDLADSAIQGNDSPTFNSVFFNSLSNVSSPLYRDWTFGAGTGDDSFAIQSETGIDTGLMSTVYSLSATGTPTNAFDLITKQYADANYITSLNGVTSANITDGTITSADIASNTITGSNISNNSIAQIDMQDNSIGGLQIIDESIGSSDIANGEIDEADLDTSVNASLDLADSALQSIDAGSIGTSEILDSSINEVDLDAVNAPTDEYILTWEQTGNYFEWVDPSTLGGGGSELTTVSDTGEIDLTLTTYDITASIVSGSIDEAKLDASVNASLDLADSSVQPSDNISTLTNDSGFITSQTDDQTASEVPVTDSGGYYTGTELEAVTQEIGAELENSAWGETVLTANKTGVLSDKNGVITNSTASNYTYTINEDVFPDVGQVLNFENWSTGDIIIAYGTNVTGDAAQTINVNGKLTLWQRTANNWVIYDGEAVLTQAEYTALSSGIESNARFNFLFTD